ncbi:succinylglutamate desuccinylase/aspartoacylase family protein [candidate division KSB1 bacterium]|nr:succinylglutamate desuccinylase/aspartoacylase family protein [candidate division KSB1 bacterium]
MLVLGGTHPNEPAGFLAAYVLTEHLSMERGRAIIIPRANRSAFTHTEPGDATPAFVEIPTVDGARKFRVGSRTTSPLDQWPDPDVYRHTPSGQELSGAETRNLNRSFPGRTDGNFTERIAAAITHLIEREGVDLVIDLHEASPEYPVINAIIAHDRALELATMANFNLQAAGLNYAIEPSPRNFHGLSHRELGDATQALAILMETANVTQGRLRGASSADRVLSGQDDCYERAARAGLVRVPFDSSGISIEERVGRHLSGVRALIDALAFVLPDKPLSARGIPEFADLRRLGIGHYLAGPTPH